MLHRQNIIIAKAGYFRDKKTADKQLYFNDILILL